MNEIELKEQFDLLFTPGELEDMRKFDELEKRVAVIKDARKEAVMKFLKDNGLESYRQFDIKLNYIAPFVRKTVDTKKMKEEGIYDLYTKESNVDETVRITIDYGD